MSHAKRNWSEYNRRLINRGDLTFWINEDTCKSWFSKKVKGKNGRPFIFSDKAIETLMQVKYLFGLSYRQLEGFINYLFRILKVELPVPCYTQICKRMKSLNVTRHLQLKKQARHIVLDTTGLKIYGEGEWKVKKHGKSKRRRWKKMHLAVDEKTQDIVFAEVTDDHVADTAFAPEIMKKHSKIKRFLIDGIGDCDKLYHLAWLLRIDLLTPPRKTAALRTEPWMQDRNNRLREILGLGGDLAAKSLWAKLTGYSKRVTVESAIARWKKLFGHSLESRSDTRQHNEVYLKSLLLNRI